MTKSKTKATKNLPFPLDNNPVTDEERYDAEKLNERTIDERVSLLETFSTRAVVPSETGTYLLRVDAVAGGSAVSYIPFPELPTQEGSYILRASVVSDKIELTWQDLK